MKTALGTFNYEIEGKCRCWVPSLADALPHGSGINSRWIITDMKTYIRAENSFDPMNEAGFYMSSVPFTLTIRGLPYNPEFKLHFHGTWAQYAKERYGIKDYLEDTFAWALDEWAKSKGKNVPRSRRQKYHEDEEGVESEIIYAISKRESNINLPNM